MQTYNKQLTDDLQRADNHSVLRGEGEVDGVRTYFVRRPMPDEGIVTYDNSDCFGWETPTEVAEREAKDAA